MTQIKDDTLLKTTRGVIYFVLGIVAVAGGALAIASIAVPIWWSDIVAMAVKENPEVDMAGLLPPLLVMFAGCIVILGLVWTALRKLLAIVRTVGEGDPFVTANAVRLRAIGWLLVAIEVIGIPLALLAGNIADRFGDSDTGLDFSPTGLLAILLAFVLARVFERGAAMREEMEGTV